MAPKVMSLTFLLATFLHLSLASLEPRPSLVVKPKSRYFVGKNRPAKLMCEARDAEDITFTCNGIQIPPTSLETDDPYADSDLESVVLRASIEVPRGDIINYQKQQKAQLAAAGKRGEKTRPFWCQCSALDAGGEVVDTSHRSVIRVAHLKREWSQQPQDSLVSAGDNAELLCGAPEGSPTPEISWKKDGIPVDLLSDSRLFVTETGSLVITDVWEEDAGLYRCVAQNTAGRRLSREAELSVAGATESPESPVFISDEDGDRVEIVKSRSPRQTEVVHPPRITRGLNKNYYVPKDGTTTLACGAVAVESIAFRCDGDRLEAPNDHFEIKTTTGITGDGSQEKIIQATLTIHSDYLDALGKDRVRCQCVAYFHVEDDGWSSVNTSEKNGNVILSYLGDRFYRHPSDVTARVGENATLDCRLPRGTPNPWVIWYKDGQVLQLRSRDDYHVKKRAGSLTILSVKMSDAGSYVCGAKNPIGVRRSRAARLTVVEDRDGGSSMPEVPEFVEDLPAERTIEPNGQVRVRCVATSVSEIDFVCGGSRIHPRDLEKDEQTHRSSGKKLLSLHYDVTEERVKAGPSNYYCQCIAWYGIETGQWKKVESTRGFIRLSAQPTTTQATRRAYLRDRFVQGPRDIQVRYHEQAILVCRPPDGQPRPRVYWLKDGDLVDPARNSNFVLQPNGDLAIEFAEEAEAGIYTCVAENAAGRRASNQAVLAVVDIPTTTVASRTPTDPTGGEGEIIDPDEVDPTEHRRRKPTREQILDPIFIKQPEEQNVITRGQSIQLTCLVFGSKYLTFHCNGVQMDVPKNSSSHTVDYETNEPIVESILTLTDDQVTHEFGANATCYCKAQYIDKITNQWNQTRTAEFYITSAYLKKRFQQEPQAVGPTLGSDVTLRCIPPQGHPKPEVLWVKDQTPVAESERIRIEDPGHLVIRDFRKQDQGEYYCVARNEAAARRSSSVPVNLNLVIEPTEETPTDKKTPGTGDGQPTGVVTDPNMFSQPHFTRNLNNRYFVVSNKPARLACEAEHVSAIEMLCIGQRVDAQIRMREKQKRDKNEEPIMVKVTSAMFEVNYNELKPRLDRQETFECVCNGTYTDKQGKEAYILTNLAYLEIAYLDSEFTETAESMEFKKGQFAVLQCGQPNGNPKPTVMWTKGGAAVQQPNVQVLPNGHLVLHGIMKSDAGEYQCVVSNLAGRRRGRKLMITVTDSGSVGPGGNGARTTTDVPAETTGMGAAGGSELEGAATGQGEAVVTRGEGDVVVPETTPGGAVIVPGGETGVGEPEPGSQDGKAAGTGTPQPGETMGPGVENDVGTGAPRPTDRSGAAVETDSPGKQQAVPGTGEETSPATPDGSPEGEKTPMPEGEKTPMPDGGITPVPDGENIPISEGGNTPVPEGENVPTPEGGSTPVPDGENIPISEGGNTPVPEGENIPTPEGGSTPVPDGENIPISDGGSTPVPEGENGPTSDGENTPIPEGGNTPGPGGEKLTRGPLVGSDHTGGVVIDAVGESVTPEPGAEGDTDVSQSGTSDTGKEHGRDMGSSGGDRVKSEKDVSMSPEDEGSTGMSRGSQDGGDTAGTGGEQSKSNMDVTEGGEGGRHMDNSQEEVQEEIIVPGQGSEVSSSGGSTGMGGETLGNADQGKTMTDVVPEDGREIVGVKPGSTMADACTEKIQNCTSMSPYDYQSCLMKEQFKDCVEEFLDMCQNTTSEFTTTMLVQKYNEVDDTCASLEECKMKLEECYISHVLPNEDGAFNVLELCNRREDYIQCTHQALEMECKMEMVPPMEDKETSMEEVSAWLQDYCDALVFNEASTLASCEMISECSLIEEEEGSMSNTTFWCNGVSKLIACSSDAVNECNLDELRGPLQNLYERSKDMYCNDPMGPDVDPEPAGEEGTGGKDGENGGTAETGGEEPEGNNGEGAEETGAAATKQEEDDKDGGSALSVSLLLPVALQIMVAAILSRR